MLIKREKRKVFTIKTVRRQRTLASRMRRRRQLCTRARAYESMFSGATLQNTRPNFLYRVVVQSQLSPFQGHIIFFFVTFRHNLFCLCITDEIFVIYIHAVFKNSWHNSLQYLPSHCRYSTGKYATNLLDFRS